MILVERNAITMQELNDIMLTTDIETKQEVRDLIEIVTLSGDCYYYDRHTNRISDSPIGMSECNEVEFTPVDAVPDAPIIHFCIEITRQCNFRCNYCCYSGNYNGWRTHSRQSQTNDNLNKITSFIENSSPKDSPFSVAFYGGEALLEVEMIKCFVEKMRSRYGDRISFSLTSNGFLLTHQVVDYICSIPRFSINVTVDGDEAMHDANRVLADGQGTFRRIIKNLEDFQLRYPKDFEERIGFLATLHSTEELPRLNDAWMSNELLKNHLPKHISMIVPNFSQDVKGTSLKQKLEVLYIALEHYKKGLNDVLTSQLLEITSSVRNREIYDLPEGNYPSSNCLTHIESCFIDCDGNLAPCEKVCDSFRIGNVENGFDWIKIKAYENSFISFQNTHCKTCWAQRLCSICLKHLEFSETEMEYICQKERDFAKLSLLMLCELVELELEE